MNVCRTTVEFNSRCGKFRRAATTREIASILLRSNEVFPVLLPACRPLETKDSISSHNICLVHLACYILSKCLYINLKPDNRSYRGLCFAEHLRASSHLEIGSNYTHNGVGLESS